MQEPARLLNIKFRTTNQPEIHFEDEIIFFFFFKLLLFCCKKNAIQKFDLSRSKHSLKMNYIII